ncbi:alpha/beta hydrolase [Streptomyces gilvosporeus]|uniref:alpha/beta hydrolase n=1 Tax=Streptomyces gilvosporeus TaxID=553510 RepID=UPI001F3D7A13|nr:alpha/beta fold hydrolase [Streptomyces gilvosporeus]
MTATVITEEPPVEAHRVESVTAADGTPLALHQWIPKNPKAAVFYVHGLQSHAGWLFETGPELARRQIAVYAPDRRGSGSSGGPRGHLPSSAAVLDDYTAHFEAVRARHPEHLPVTAVGQSFGGSVLAALLATGRISPDGVVLCAPALGQQQARHGQEGVRRLRTLQGHRTSPVTLKDEDYTRQQPYLAFMANDHAMLRQITDGFRAVMAELELLYTEGPRWDIGSPAAPVHFARPERDPIIDLDTARSTLARMCPDTVDAHFDADSHYLEFSPVRAQFWDWLADVALRTPKAPAPPTDAAAIAGAAAPAGHRTQPAACPGGPR